MLDSPENSQKPEERQSAGSPEPRASDGATRRVSPYAIIWKDGVELELY